MHFKPFLHLRGAFFFLFFFHTLGGGGQRKYGNFHTFFEPFPKQSYVTISDNLAIGFLPRHDVTGNGWRHKPELVTNLSWSLEELQREIEDNSFSVAELILNHSRPDMWAMFNDDRNLNPESLIWSV